MDKQIIDIGGSNLPDTLDNQLPQAFRGIGDFPKEIAYTKGMEKWNDIADASYQTTDELKIIESSVSRVVSELPSGTTIIDLGAANSTKYEPYVREFMRQGKSCTYVPLDLERNSVGAQIRRAKSKFPGINVYGLWGSFVDGDAYYGNIEGPRLFLSMGSIFYNGPEHVVKDRLQQFRKHLDRRPHDRLIVGQDSPATTGSSAHSAYNTKQYGAFLESYLLAIQESAGIREDSGEAWSVKSTMDKSMHYFEVTARKDVVCRLFDGYVVKKGTVFKMFKSWKRTEEDIEARTRDEGLHITVIGRSETSGMRQYMLQG